jgi:hypothetical protein
MLSEQVHICIHDKHPCFDTVSGPVKTLEPALNECRARNGLAALDSASGLPVNGPAVR